MKMIRTKPQSYLKTAFQPLALFFLTVVLLLVSGCDPNDTDYDVDAGPTVLTFSPEAAGPGETVVIEGYRLEEATEVKFGNGVAEIMNATPTSLTVTVPANASTGKVSVTTPAGTHASTDDFEVLVD